MREAGDLDISSMIALTESGRIGIERNQRME